MVKNYRLSQVLYLTVLIGYIGCNALQAQTAGAIDQLRNKAETLYAEGDYDQALTYYQDGYRLARKLDKVRAANLAVDISSIYHMQGNYQRGAKLCYEGILLLKQAPSQPDSVWFKLNSSLGEMYKKLNKQDSCYLYFSRANIILQKHPELENRIANYVIYHYNNQGMMYVRAGGFSEGFSYLTKAIAIAEKYTKSKEDLAILQNNLGELHEKLGEFDKALSLRKSAVLLCSNHDYLKCNIYVGITWNALQSHKYPEAYRSAKIALGLYQKIEQEGILKGNLPLKLKILQYLGDYYCASGNADKADFFYDSIIVQSSENFGQTYIRSKLGKATVQQLRNNLPKALAYCEQAINASYFNASPTERVIWEQGLFDAQTRKATLLIQQFQQQKNIKLIQLALNAYQESLQIADAMRKSFTVLDTKWFFATKVRQTYITAFETAYQLYTQTHLTTDKERAFSLMERSKAASLTDITRELLIKPANVPADLINQERKLQQTITTQKLEFTGTPSTQLIDAQIQLAQLQQRLEKEFPAYYRAKYQAQTIQSTQIQPMLDDHMAYLSYLLTQDALYISVVTHDGLTVIRKSGDLNTLKAALNKLRDVLYTNPGLGNYTGGSAAIVGYRWLIEPIAPLLEGKDRLLISADGDLHRIPFEVLETGNAADDFLVKKYATSYIPSANALLNQLNTASPTAKDLLALAPFVKPVGPNAKALALPYLPASQAEVEQLPGESLLGKAATKRRFMRTYDQYRVLHLATHAYANIIEPARSYVAFYPDGNPDKLYAEEIYTMSFAHTHLVVLSACETGNGTLRTGEGIMSLAQAFAYAGCPSIVSTLWHAHDDSMAYLSQQLHEQLQEGLPIDVALQRTKLAYFQSELYLKLNHPHYWANLVLMGDHRPVYSVTWPKTGLAILLIGILGISGILLFRQRSKAGSVAIR